MRGRFSTLQSTSGVVACSNDRPPNSADIAGAAVAADLKGRELLVGRYPDIFGVDAAP